MVQSNSYLNEWRLADYRRVFEDHWPGHSDWLGIEDYPGQSDLDALRAAANCRGSATRNCARRLDLITTLAKPGA